MPPSKRFIMIWNKIRPGLDRFQRFREQKELLVVVTRYKVMFTKNRVLGIRIKNVSSDFNVKL